MFESLTLKLKSTLCLTYAHQNNQHQQPSLLGTRLQFSADLIAGLTLVLSVTISILLLAGLSESVITAAAILSAIVTFLTGFSSYMGYQNRYEKHCMSSTQFASVQQNIYTVLQTDTDKGIAENIGTLTTDFNNAREQMPIIQDDIVRQYVDEKGYALFPDIVEEMVSLSGCISILVVSYFLSSGAFDSFALHLSYSITSLASHITTILISNLFPILKAMERIG